MTKRLKYTKDILTHMLNNNNKPMTTGSVASKRSDAQGLADQIGTNRRPLNVIN